MHLVTQGQTVCLCRRDTDYATNTPSPPTHTDMMKLWLNTQLLSILVNLDFYKFIIHFCLTFKNCCLFVTFFNCSAVQWMRFIAASGTSSWCFLMYCFYFFIILYVDEIFSIWFWRLWDGVLWEGLSGHSMSPWSERWHTLQIIYMLICECAASKQ